MVKKMSSTTSEFTTFFQSNPGRLFLVLNPDLTIIDASDEYLAATLTWREEIQGAAMFDVFPDNPQQPGDGVTNLNSSFQNVLKTGSADTMALQRYDIQDRVASRGSWVEKYWTPLNFPIFGKGSREITHIVHEVIDFSRTTYLKKCLQEQFTANSEQQATLRDMLRDLMKKPGT